VAQIIDFAEIRGAREAQRAAVEERRSLEDAVETIRLNLAAVVERLRDAAGADRAELAGRMEKLSAMLRYGILLLDGPSQSAER
jgi:ribosome-binding protein aMBF1 (putative translation factor)